MKYCVIELIFNMLVLTSEICFHDSSVLINAHPTRSRLFMIITPAGKFLNRFGPILDFNKSSKYNFIDCIFLQIEQSVLQKIPDVAVER